MDLGPLFALLVAVFRDVFLVTAGLLMTAWIALVIISLLVDVFSPRELRQSDQPLL